MSKKKNNKDSRLSLVVGVYPEKYTVDDGRLMKPVCHQKIKNGVLEGSMLVQSIDEVTINSKKKITYFILNNIALLLSQSQKSLAKAKEIYNMKFLDSEFELDFEKMEGEKKSSSTNASSLVCDYLEKYRNDIIHQKTIDHTEFYKVYFKPGTFDACKSPILVIRFFHDAHADENRTNPIWPWIKLVRNL